MRRNAISLFAVGSALALVTVGAATGVSAAPSPGSAAAIASTDPSVVHLDVEANRDTFNSASFPGSLYNTAITIGADEMWSNGFDGRGIDVALIDTGIAPVEGLASGNVVFGADVSIDAMGDELDGLDGFGHGTHMAGIIAGRDAGAPTKADQLKDFAKTGFVGIAPGSRIVNVRAGAADGAVDVSQLIAAIDWVVQNRRTGGRNIRVLNVSFGTSGIQDSQIDPLTYAVENAWRKGIVVVVSAGNDGVGTNKLDNPAYDPFVIAVGALDSQGTLDESDDAIADFSSRGESARRPDFVAPGRSIVSLRVPNSALDNEYPEGRVLDRYMRGSGTSQAAAVVSGAVALLLQAYPSLTPDQVKAVLTATGRRIPTQAGTLLDKGMRSIDLNAARDQASKVAGKATPAMVQKFTPGTGTGSLDAARGADRLDGDGPALTGEMDILGRPWDPSTWTAATSADKAWAASNWLGAPFANTSFSGRLWNGMVWDGHRWRGTWDGHRWLGSGWLDNTWDGHRWLGHRWLGHRWLAGGWS